MAAGVTGGLFYFMQYLIETSDRLADPVQVVRVVDATMPEFALEVIEEIEEPQPIEVVEEEYTPPERQPVLGPTPSTGIVNSEAAAVTGVDLTPTEIVIGNSELVPLVAIAPQYPTRAAQRGIEGWCLVSFTVDGRGNVIEDSIVVVEAEPPGVFDRTSMRAVTRFKYQPQVVDGEGVEVPGVQYLFRYDLEN